MATFGRPADALALAQQSVTRYGDWDTTYRVPITAYVQADQLPEAHTALSKLVWHVFGSSRRFTFE